MFRFWQNQCEIPLKFRRLIYLVCAARISKSLVIVPKYTTPWTMDACFLSFHVHGLHFGTLSTLSASQEWHLKFALSRFTFGWIVHARVDVSVSSPLPLERFTPLRSQPLLQHNSIDGTWKWNVARWLFVHVATKHRIQNDELEQQCDGHGHSRTPQTHTTIDEKQRETNGRHKAHFNSANLPEDMVFVCAPHTKSRFG